MYQVLVIDDDSAVRSVIRLVLERANARIEEAQDGRKGLEFARRNRPDLILCDLDMPVMDGFETLSRLRHDPGMRTVPVIMVSGMITEETERRVMGLGATAVLRKPFSLNALADLAKTLLTEPKPDNNPDDPPWPPPAGQANGPGQ
jgi:CheY-like chemotaxis protein